jgi:hypothetical protein
LAAEARVVFPVLQLVALAQIQFFRLLHLLVAAVVELKMVTVLLAGQAAVVAVGRLLAAAELQAKALRAVMAHLVGQ